MTTETIDDITTGDNFGTTEKQIIKDGKDQIKKYNKLIDKHDRTIGEIHQVIIAFGRTLQAGRDLYAENIAFKHWVERNHLDMGTMGKKQQERTACMIIARLYDTGVECDGDDDGTCTPSRLDLTGCPNTVPTGILKWARISQRHLFPNMGPSPAAIARPRKVTIDADLLQSVLDDTETKLSPTVRAMIVRVLR